jgi:murein lipoprotein
MKKNFLLISLMVVFAFVLTGCATTSDLEKMQAQDRETNAKADQALKASQDANANAVKAADAAARAEEALKAAEARALAAEERAKAAEEQKKAAEEKANKAEAVFEKSMRK